MKNNREPGSEQIFRTVCSCHCGGRCVLNVHVESGRIIRIENDSEAEPQLKPCVRGRAYRQRVYSPDRILYPLRRKGARGEGKFDRVTWDEALDAIAGTLKSVKEAFGPASILFLKSCGDQSALHGAGVIERLLCLYGGCTRTWGSLSNEGGAFAALTTFGSQRVRATHDDLLNSRLIILWGWNPTDTICGHASWYLTQAKEKGIKIITVDPKFTDTAAALSSEWVPVVPGTDSALMIAIAYVMLEKSLQDQFFLDRYTYGFDRFKEYVTGKEDGIPKSPLWAESITGVPAARIEKLAVEYATSKPAALIAGIAPGRSAYGEQYHRAAITLAAMTGNIGKSGGSSGGMVWAIVWGGYPFIKMTRDIVSGPGYVANPIEHNTPSRKNAPRNYGQSATTARINYAEVADAILRGKSGGYPANFKFLYIVGTNYPNQAPNINKAAEALKKLDFIVAHEQVMTPAAKFADIVLPVSTLFERNDVTTGHVTPPICGYMRKVIEPLGESRSHFEIAQELAARLGVADFSDRTEDDWLREMTAAEVPDFPKFKERGYQTFNLSKPHVAFADEIRDPAGHPFPTATGKIEIFSQQLADMNIPEIPPIPKYFPSWEGRGSPLAAKYPLQLVSTHLRRRANTQFEQVPWLRELQEQVVFLNPADAKVRQIEDGNEVRVFNDRGEMVIPAKVTERIMPGVVCVPQGAWYSPDMKGTDRGGSANVLTKDQASPGGAPTYNTCLVQIEKV